MDHFELKLSIKFFIFSGIIKLNLNDCNSQWLWWRGANHLPLFFSKIEILIQTKCRHKIKKHFLKYFLQDSKNDAQCWNEHVIGDIRIFWNSISIFVIASNSNMLFYMPECKMSTMSTLRARNKREAVRGIIRCRLR